jgi:hypothetical protein
LEALVPETETGADEEIDDLGIKDTVIRELARALQPRQGGKIVARLRPKLEGSNPHRTGRSENAQNLGS